MKNIKEKVGKLLLLLCICLSIGAVANATDKTSANVEITIEADNVRQHEIDKNTKTTIQKNEEIKTGDQADWLKYIAVIGIVSVVIVCAWKKKKGMLAIFAFFVVAFFTKNSVMATNTAENVNVTIPTNISISFDESGENHISEFGVSNQSLVPITIENILVTEHNQWELVEKESEIPVNTKKLAFAIEGKYLYAGENPMSIPITEKTYKMLDVYVERGAWTNSNTKEKALELEFEYTLGKKEFALIFDTNGSDATVESKYVCNGDTVKLPTVEREGYELEGWEDSEGNLYKEEYIMPIGGETLKARWKEKIAYAIYSATDKSLRFIRTADTIQVGDTYNGRVVTDIFTGFEESEYASVKQVPWYDGNSYDSRVIKNIVFESTIKPKSTAYWFYNTKDCVSMDVSKLDMSQVKNMSYMMAWAGSDSSTFTITGIDKWDVSNVTNARGTFTRTGFSTKTLRVDLSNWNVSKMTNMYDMFYAMGYYSTSFSLGDLSKWDVSSAVDVQGMFQQTGYSATWSLNLSNWNVKNVRYNTCFCLTIESKIVQPKWVI